MNDRTHSNRRPLLATIGVALMTASLATPARASDMVTRTRELPAFDRIALDGAFTATVVAGSARHFTMTGRPEDLERVTVAVADGRLTVGMRSGARNVGTIALDIALPALRALENEGVGRVHLGGLHGDLDLENRGAATIDAAGRAGDLTIVNDGVGRIDATALDARTATVTNDGVGSIVVRSRGSLVMNVNGVGDIRYAGNPTHVESNVNGLGRIRRV